MVYFIEGGGYTKIGKADDPQKRLRELQTGSPFPLTLKFVTEGGFEKESQIHSALSKYRVNGEWFEITYDWCDEFVDFLVKSNKVESNVEKTKKYKNLFQYNNEVSETKKQKVFNVLEKVNACKYNKKISITEISEKTKISFAVVKKYCNEWNGFDNVVINQNKISKENKINELQSVLNQMKIDGDKINKKSLSEKSGVSRTTITKHWDKLKK